MAFTIEAHETDCTPLKACRSCKLLTFLKLNLRGKAFDEYFQIIGIESPNLEEIKGIAPDASLKELVGITNRIRDCLLNDNITTVGELLQKTEYELRRIPNFGEKSLRDLRTILAQHGWQLGITPQPPNT